MDEVVKVEGEEDTKLELGLRGGEVMRIGAATGANAVDVQMKRDGT